jgi:hypothetical protein
VSESGTTKTSSATHRSQQSSLTWLKPMLEPILEMCWSSVIWMKSRGPEPWPSCDGATFQIDWRLVPTSTTIRSSGVTTDRSGQGPTQRRIVDPSLSHPTISVRVCLGLDGHRSRPSGAGETEQRFRTVDGTVPAALRLLRKSS